MKTSEHVRDVLEAIESVKLRIEQAHKSGQFCSITSLLLDLAALQACLAVEVEKLLKGDKAA